MPTPHEELLTLKKKLSAALDASIKAEVRGVGRVPLFGFKKHLREYSARVKELNEAYEALGVQYIDTFAEVLKNNHGVDWNNVVNPRAGECMEPTHSFTALVGNKIRKMEAVSVGNRIVFFLDGVALGENEKADYGTINV